MKGNESVWPFMTDKVCLMPDWNGSWVYTPQKDMGCGRPDTGYGSCRRINQHVMAFLAIVRQGIHSFSISCNCLIMRLCTNLLCNSEFMPRAESISSRWWSRRSCFSHKVICNLLPKTWVPKWTEMPTDRMCLFLPDGCTIRIYDSFSTYARGYIAEQIHKKN